MITKCADCGSTYDDTDRTTICPHELIMPAADLEQKKSGLALTEPTLGDAPIEAQYIETMNKLARFIDQRFNGLAKGNSRKTGFVLLVFPFGENDGGRCNFISNGADRADLAVLFKEMSARMAGMPEVKGGRA